MTAQIYIASKPILFGANWINHLYLVYDPNGDLSSTTDQKIIRGGPEYSDPLNHGSIVIENGIDLLSSADTLAIDPDDPNTLYLTPSDRNYTLLDLNGRSAEDVWAEMMAFVSGMGTPDVIPNVVNSDISYDASALNSNSIIASVLANSGILLQDNAPHDGSTGIELPLFTFPAGDVIVGKSSTTSGDHLYIGSDIEYIDGRAGNDTADFSMSDEHVIVYLDQEKFVTGSLEIIDTIKNIENIIGTDFSDTIIGNSQDNILKGGAGIDNISGGSGIDILYGDANNDLLNGGAGVDTVYGGTGNDTIVFNTSENSFFEPLDEFVYGGTGVGETDTLKIELSSGDLTGALRDEILSVYYNWMVLNTTATEKDFDFSTLRLQAYDFENLQVTIDGQIVSLQTQAKNDDFMLQQNGSLNGNLFSNNGNGIDYTFGSALSVAAGTYATVNGGTIVVSLDGSFAYTANTGYTGVDSFAYTVTDTSGITSNATAYFSVQQILSGTALNDNLGNPEASKPQYIFGGDGSDSLFGGRFYNDYLDGGNGNDFLIGYGGNDILIGGTGNDTLIGEEGSDIAYGGDGNDTFQEQLSPDLSKPQNDIYYGEMGDDTFYSYAGNDYIDGGDGHDRLYFDPSKSAINLDLSSGIIAVGGYTVIFANIEGAGGTNSNDTLTGNSLNNYFFGYNGDDTIYGLGGNDILEGGDGNDILDGGEGADSYKGGSGNDTFIIDNSLDTITETSTWGVNDTAIASISYVLPSYVESLVLSGSDNLNGTGNSLANTITGNVGNNILNGGSGIDTLIGGLGNDTYIVDNTSDVITENSNAGIDLVQSSASYTLSANVENLTLTGFSTLSGTGNGSDNTIIGNDAANTLNGGDGNDTLNGKFGVDTLIGGLGADTFVIESGSIDTIMDFSAGQGDILKISDLLIGYTNGVSDINDFVSFTTSGSNTNFVIDRDGAGTAYTDQSIATLSNVTGLVVDDLFNNNQIVV